MTPLEALQKLQAMTVMCPECGGAGEIEDDVILVASPCLECHRSGTLPCFPSLWMACSYTETFDDKQVHPKRCWKCSGTGRVPTPLDAVQAEDGLRAIASNGKWAADLRINVDGEFECRIYEPEIYGYDYIVKRYSAKGVDAVLLALAAAVKEE